ncbi:MAG TPA: LysM peptidoglycan-binding domain-containing protein [Candidatus Woesebacteria bacterium]|jgi:nucleoid-associated protein YgaU|nr:LysM peptidoglycan-binding domain-containing protein [Candidatus Woesebacteria bacterium]HNS94547.1 LysM peptidoglycan-binding domain-containing protein [Candidatus Woesebacteria bacterium]
MNSTNEQTENKTENVYVAELKSLLKDKFFMLLLGISVAIVLLSTVYSFLRPKTDENVTASVSDQAATTMNDTDEKADSVIPVDTVLSPTLALNVEEGIAGLETAREESEESPSFFGKLRETAQGLFGRKDPTEGDDKMSDDEVDATGTTPDAVSEVKVGATYVVQEGDTLWDLAERTYSSGYNFVDIAQSNSIINPDYIVVGQEVKLPSVQPKESTVGQVNGGAAMTRAEGAIPATYTVTEGDTLWDIAGTQFNDSYQWVKIAQLNSSVTNPDVIVPGQVLKLK